MFGWKTGAGAALVSALILWWLFATPSGVASSPTVGVEAPADSFEPAGTATALQPEGALTDGATRWTAGSDREQAGAIEFRPGHGGVRVHTTWAATGEPAAGIELFAHIGGFCVATDARGIAEFVDVPPARDFLVRRDSFWSGLTVTVRPGEWIDVALRLPPPIELTVRVTDSEGAPVENARVWAHTRDRRPVSASTDRDGRCLLHDLSSVSSVSALHGGRSATRRLYGLSPGPAHLDLVLAGERTHSVRTRILAQDDLGRPLPGTRVTDNRVSTTTAADGRAEFEVWGSKPTHIELEHPDHALTSSMLRPDPAVQVFTLPRLATLDVHVSANGKPLPWARVYGHGDAFTDAHGRATVRVPPGETRLSVSKAGFTDSYRKLELLPGERATCRIELEAGLRLIGRIVTRHGQPVPDWRVNGCPTDAAGEFVLSGLSPGTKKLVVGPRQHAFPVAHRVIYANPLDSPIEIVVDPTAVGSLRGRFELTSAQRLHTVLELNHAESNTTRLVPIGADGAFHVDGLAEGRYFLDAIKLAQGLAGHHRYGPFEVTAGSTCDTGQLHSPKACDYTIKVERGSIGPGLEILFTARADSGSPIPATEHSGHLRFAIAPVAGRYRVQAEGPGVDSTPSLLEFRDGAPNVHTIRLRATPEIALTIRSGSQSRLPVAIRVFSTRRELVAEFEADVASRHTIRFGLPPGEYQAELDVVGTTTTSGLHVSEGKNATTLVVPN